MADSAEDWQFDEQGVPEFVKNLPPEQRHEIMDLARQSQALNADLAELFDSMADSHLAASDGSQACTDHTTSMALMAEAARATRRGEFSRSRELQESAQRYYRPDVRYTFTDPQRDDKPQPDQ
ncbi:hypothetical protein [Sciscionella sediminilitoris]|uniref:hypothetical protein n=1 Tax=Sciscionella sediminilitoris TaxID=1445613 RepID=UPI0012E22EB1|nr:hypothetical protein [Sciscionella sp. SE31]